MNLGWGRMLFFVQRLLPGWRLTRQRNLALLAMGLARLRDGHLTISETARSIPAHTDHWHKFKRIQRFLTKRRWSPKERFASLVQFALKRFYPGHYLPVIIDQSTPPWRVVGRCSGSACLGWLSERCASPGYSPTSKSSTPRTMHAGLSITKAGRSQSRIALIHV